MKKSVMSAVGSMEIKGASRWLAALDEMGAVPTIKAITVTPTTSTLSNLRIGNSLSIDQIVTLMRISKCGVVMSNFDKILNPIFLISFWNLKGFTIYTQTGLFCIYEISDRDLTLGFFNKNHLLSRLATRLPYPSAESNVCQAKASALSRTVQLFERRWGCQSHALCAVRLALRDYI